MESKTTGRYIDDGYLDRLKEAIDPFELVSRYTQLKPSGKSHSGCCPFHDEKTPSFHVYPDGGFKCWGGGCDASGGDVISFLMKAESLDFVPAVERLADIAGMPLPRTENRLTDDESRQWRVLQEVTEWYEGAVKFFSDDAEGYLKRRGITAESRQKHRLGYAAKRANHLDPLIERHGIEPFKALGLVRESRERPGEVYAFFRDRLVIPVLNRAGKTIGLVGRAVSSEAHAKYLTLNTPFFRRENAVYGEHMADGSGPVYMCEGPLDAIIVNQQLGFDARAPLGVDVTLEQINRIIYRREGVEVLVDGDKAGRIASMSLARLIAGQLDRPVDVGFRAFPNGEDPASWLISGNDLESLERLALDEMLIRSAARLFDLKSWVGRAHAAEWLAEMLPPTPAGPAIEVLRAAFAEGIGVPAQAVVKADD